MKHPYPVSRAALAILTLALLQACSRSQAPTNLGSSPAQPAPENDQLPAISVTALPPIREGLAGDATRLRFELRLTRTSDQPVRVQVKTADGSATAGTDYDALDQAIEIPAGERRAYVSVNILDDAQSEPDEHFTLTLSEPVNAQLGIAQTQGTILDNDLASGCDPLPATGLCAGAAEGALRIPVGVPLGGYLRPPVGGEYIPGLEAASQGDLVPFFNQLLDFIPAISEAGGPNVVLPNEARKSQYSTLSPSSRGYNDSLVTKAVALTSGGQTLVFVKLDTIGMIDELAVGVRDEVKARTGIDLGDGLIMNGTHTHDGPGAIGNFSLKYFWAAIDVYHQDLVAKVVSDIADVVVQALANRVPARIGYATGIEGEVGGSSLNSWRRSRLSSYTEERIAQQELFRRRIGVFRVDQVTASGAFERPLAMMVNYAAHGIMFDVENLFFSGDCLAGMERSVQARFDSPVVVMDVQSAAGDVSPRADGDPTRQRIERFGELLAPQVLKLWDSVNNFNAAPTLKVLSQRFILNREKLGYTGDEYPYPFGAVQCNAQANTSICIPAGVAGPEDLADNGVAENDAFVPQDSRVLVAQVGDALLLAQPGEPLTEQGLRLIDASPFPYDRTFVWGYSLDHVGYILPNEKEDWLMGGTEGTTTFWGWKQGQLILDRTKGLMDAIANGTPPPADEFALKYTTLPGVPAVVTLSLQPGQVLIQPQSLTRFDSHTFRFIGGDPVIDLPTVTLEEEVEGQWVPMRRREGRVLDQFYEYWIEYRLTNLDHAWTVRFEPPKDWPAGHYRYHVRGVAQSAPGSSAYDIVSDAFEVNDASTLMLENLARDGDSVSATLSYTAVPHNYRLIDPAGDTALPPPVREGFVRFTLGGRSVVAHAPQFTQTEDGRTLATYRATLPGSELPSAYGEDRWGNHTP